MNHLSRCFQKLITMKIKLSHTSKFQLFIIPIVFIVLQLLLKIDYKYYFTSAYDPSYAFLFNGLSLANGDFGSGLAGFPGTPVQIYVAMVIRLGHLLRFTTPLIEDVFNDPEYYLNIAGHGIFLLISLSLLLSGTILYKHTKNLALSLAIQLIPFLSITGLHFSSVIMCEPFLVLSIQGIALQLALYCNTKESNPGKRQILFLSFYTAMGLTTKIVFIPVFLLPFFAINGWATRLKYLFLTFLISAVFLIPAYPDREIFISWIRLLLLYKGVYGSGESGILDMGSFIYNLKEIFLTDLLFTLILILILIYLIMGIIPGIKKNILRKNYRIVFGAVAVVFIQLILIGKHYLPHYMISVYSLIFTALLLSFTGFRRFAFLTKYNERINLLSVILAGALLIIRFLQSFSFSPGLKHPYTETVAYVNNNVRDEQRIIVEGFSNAFKEHALYFGLVFSSRSINKYRPVLKKLYPETFFYNLNQQRYFDWYSDITPLEILSLNKTTWLSIKSKTDTIPANLLTELSNLRNHGLITGFNLDYKNPAAFDFLYKIESDTNKLKKQLREKESIICDCESLSEDGKVFTSTDGVYNFSKSFMRSEEKVINGQYAVKLDSHNPYALGFRLKVNRNDYLKIFVWRNSYDDKGKVVLSDDVPNGIYSDGKAIIRTKGSWQRINMNFRIPDSFQGEEVHIYLWYNGKDSCYFDDLEIRLFEGMQIINSNL